MTHYYPSEFSQNSGKSPTPRGALQVQSIDVIVQNPLDVFARIALAEGYDRERISDTDLHLSLPGMWCDHHVSLSWKSDESLLQMYLVFDFNVPASRTAQMCMLTSHLNARLTVGHFDFWQQDSALVYRQSMILSGEARLNTAQALTMLSAALDAAEKGYPASQYMLWADKTPCQAIDQALIDHADYSQRQDADLS